MVQPPPPPPSDGPSEEAVSNVETVSVQPDSEQSTKTTGAKPLVPNKQNNKRGKFWTPDVIIQAFKEIVTALLGLLIVGYTLILAQNALSVVGEQQKMSDTKDVLLLMLGLAGVVVGYYFGRVPADARAGQAQEQANAATAQAEQVNAQAQVIADQIDQVMDKMAPAVAAARSAGGPSVEPSVVTDLQRVRDELRAIANLRRRI